MILLNRTLFATLDHCVTPFGRRLLRGWLARPLLLEESIRQRQMAVRDLKVNLRSFISFEISSFIVFLFPFFSFNHIDCATYSYHINQGVALDAVSRFKRNLAGVPDLERALARLHASR